MRWIAMGVLFVGSAAWAGEPVSCEELAASEHAFESARGEVDRLVEVAFGDDFDRRIAYVDPDERDVLLEERDRAREQLPEARQDLRQARRGARQAKKSVRVGGVVCSPPDVAVVHEPSEDSAGS